jgi:transcription antitermination factor NusG
MQHWHLLRTKPSRERPVAVHLYQAGLEVYLPLVWVTPANPRAARQRPFYPCYLFARVDPAAMSPSSLRWVPGMRGIVEFSGVPATVSDAFIGELQEHLGRIRATTSLALDGRPEEPMLRIDAGPFAGYEGAFSYAKSGADRASILLACVQNQLWREKAG